MRICILCNKKETGITSFHKVPDEELKRFLWSKVCGKTLTCNSKICSDHFPLSDTYSGASRKKLMPNALPCLNIPSTVAGNEHNFDSDDSTKNNIYCGRTRTETQIVLFIQAMRYNRVLYDRRQLEYFNEFYKQRIWQDVATEHNMSVDEAKSLWRCFVACFIRCYRMELLHLVHAHYDKNTIQKLQLNTFPNEAQLTWCYYSDMYFMSEYFDKNCDTEMMRLTVLAEPIQLQEKRDLRCDSFYANNYPSRPFVFNTPTESKPTLQPSKHMNQSSCLPTALKVFKPSQAENQLASHTESASETSSDNVGKSIGLGVPAIKEKKLSEADLCLHTFFDSMFRATRSLPSSLQRRIKLQILFTVQNAQEMNENEAICSISKEE